MTCFAAALPFPILPSLPGLTAAPSRLAAAVLDGVVAQGWKAHVASCWTPSQACESSAESDAPDLELVDLLTALAVEALDRELPPRLPELLPVHFPPSAGGRPCVAADDLRQFARSELPLSDFALAILSWASLPALTAWRVVKAWGNLGEVDGGVWVTVDELRLMAPWLRGWPGECLRRALVA